MANAAKTNMWMFGAGVVISATLASAATTWTSRDDVVAARDDAKQALSEARYALDETKSLLKRDHKHELDIAELRGWIGAIERMSQTAQSENNKFVEKVTQMRAEFERLRRDVQGNP